MLDIVDASAGPMTLCDVGCGTGELLGYLRRRGFERVEYIGVDRSPTAVAFAREKFPDATFIEDDVFADECDVTRLACDYLVANGLFTTKFHLSHDEMWQLLSGTIRRLWPHIRRGLAFNVMSKNVDWEREDLFHVPIDDVARLLHELAGRNVSFRGDYGLYEYTAYAHRRAQTPKTLVLAADAGPEARVPVLRPQLPSTEKLLPYLRRIDACRTYSNHGPLVVEFEGRMGAALGLGTSRFVSAASGTAALAGAILGSAGRATNKRPFAFLPAFTFVATAVAAEQCGFRPYLIDCDPATWMITPEMVAASPVLKRCGVVVVVAPFGRPVPQAPWRAFRERTGIPVVIDGAASFDRVSARPSEFIGDVAVSLSFHATKAFGIGEGGGVATTDPQGAARIAQALNFGFRDSRDSATPSINGKLSEYHAAVALAEIDDWPQKLARYLAVAATYRDIASEFGIGDRIRVAPDIGCAYVIYQAPDAPNAETTIRRLADALIDTRQWYGRGIGSNANYKDVDGEPTVVTERLSATLIGLPLAADIARATIRRIVGCIAGPGDDKR